MKTPYMLLVLAIALLACNKNGKTDSKETVLRKIITNGVLTEEFIYSPAKKLLRINSYDELTGEFDYASGFEYDGTDRVIAENEYSNSNKITGKIMYTYETGDKIGLQEYKSLTGADSGNIISRVKYTYNGAGEITKKSWIDLNTGLITSSNNLTYYGNGNIMSSGVYYYNPLSVLQWKTEFSPEGNPVPASLLKFKGYPVNFLLYDLVSGEKHFYKYSNGLVTQEWKELFSNRQYNDNGYLLQQTITKKSILPAALSKITEMKYEYVQL